MDTIDERETRLPIPGLIKRNTLLLALSQAFAGAGGQLAFALGPLMMVALSESAALAGLSVSLFGFSRFLVAYAAGKITDTYGRKPGILLGLVLALIGTLVIGLAMMARSLPGFMVGLLTFGMGINAAYQLRVAATDMYPPNRRGEGLGYVLTGYVLGIVTGPLIVTAAQSFSEPLGLDPLGLSWLFLPVVILPGMGLVALVRPDPKEIASHLEEYYPGYRPEPRRASERQDGTSAWVLLKHYPKQVAVASYFAAYGTMGVVMVITSLALAHAGHGLAAITFSLALHTTGMFGLSLPLGRLADQFGRRAILLPGLAVELGGALLVTLTPDYGSVTLGAFLVGLGWSGVNVATTALIADTTQPSERGQAIGLNDSLASAASVLLPLAAGPIIELFGLPFTGVLMLAVMLAPLPLALALREPRPGKYVYPGGPAGAAGV
ncbi:MAG: MFS transporter [Chloroflexi bacterium]|nr:MFS transporter [Chloroflexota bacterium]